MNQMKDIRIRPPGPTYWVKIQLGTCGRSGGNPPEITTVNERAMNSMPSVVMKLGIANLTVTKPFMKPDAAHRTRPSNTAGTKGTPALSMMANDIGISAKTEPTERSNSPQIIRMVTPMATSPTSGRSPSTPRRFSAERNTPLERAWNSSARTTSNTTPASSGFSR